MSTTGEATENRSWSWQAAVDAELRKTPTEETSMEMWRLRCKEATSAFLQGENSVKLLVALPGSTLAHSIPA
jgi:hypothetical protein